MNNVSKWIWNLGMGVDSVAGLVRHLVEPETRDYDLEDLIVVTAMTGDEWTDTRELMEAYVLPLMRKHNVRYVQLAKPGPNVRKDGRYVVLSDSRQTTELCFRGAYKLSDETRDSATGPAMSSRKCSLKFKGEVIDAWLNDALPAGTHVCQMIGFEANEPTRAAGDVKHTKVGHLGSWSVTRQGCYPLIEWNWNRKACLDYIERTLGVRWEKSACSQCPFAGGCADNLPNVAARAMKPENREDALRALWVEHQMVAFNPLQELFKTTTLRATLLDNGAAELVAEHDARVAADTWGIYEVRRVFVHAQLNPRAAVRKLDGLTRDEAIQRIRDMANERDMRLSEDHETARAIFDERTTDSDKYGTREGFFVAAPATFESKIGSKNFEHMYADPQRAVAEAAERKAAAAAKKAAKKHLAVVA